MDHDVMLRAQAGVLSRAQATACGLTENDLRRMIRRRELVRVHPGVYVDHTGGLTWLQRAWAAVLFAWPAALSHDSALRAADGPTGKHQEGLIEVAVGRDRRLAAPEGVRIQRMTHLEERVMWNRSPPRVRYEEAALDVAIATPSELAALDTLAAAVQTRRTTARRMWDSLELRERCPRRAWIGGVLRDVADGACSVLEHGYLDRVERPHGLPLAQRQVRERSRLGVVYRDAAYRTFLIELDGRLFHDTAGQRDRDMDRDLDAAVDGRQTIRLGYGQVFDRPCWTAQRVGALLMQRGWAGPLRPCGPACRIGGV